jgi:hypothetical protein
MRMRAIDWTAEGAMLVIREADYISPLPPDRGERSPEATGCRPSKA